MNNCKLKKKKKSKLIENIQIRSHHSFLTDLTQALVLSDSVNYNINNNFKIQIILKMTKMEMSLLL